MLSDPFRGATLHPRTQVHGVSSSTRTYIDVHVDDIAPQKPNAGATATKVASGGSSVTSNTNNDVNSNPSSSSGTAAPAGGVTTATTATTTTTSCSSGKTGASSVPAQITNIDVNDFPTFVTYDLMDPKLARDNVDGCTRLFVGQVPYVLQPGHVAWLMHVLSGRQKPVYRVEKIVKWSQKHRACGCFHIYVHPNDVPSFLAANQRALCLMNGVAIAQNELHKEVLLHVCEILKSQGRGDDGVPMPTQLITVQEATSTFRRAPPGVNGQVVYRNTAHGAAGGGVSAPSASSSSKPHGDGFGGFHVSASHPISPDWYGFHPPTSTLGAGIDGHIHSMGDGR